MANWVFAALVAVALVALRTEGLACDHNPKFASRTYLHLKPEEKTALIAEESEYPFLQSLPENLDELFVQLDDDHLALKVRVALPRQDGKNSVYFRTKSREMGIKLDIRSHFAINCDAALDGTLISAFGNPFISIKELLDPGKHEIKFFWANTLQVRKWNKHFGELYEKDTMEQPYYTLSIWLTKNEAEVEEIENEIDAREKLETKYEGNP